MRFQMEIFLYPMEHVQATRQNPINVFCGPAGAKPVPEPSEQLIQDVVGNVQTLRLDDVFEGPQSRRVVLIMRVTDGDERAAVGEEGQRVVPRLPCPARAFFLCSR